MFGIFCNKTKIANNEQCPCGSGEIFCLCCKHRVPKEKVTLKPLEVQIMEKMNLAMKKICLHPDQVNCNGKIKNAHALQNSKIISRLAGSDHHIYMLNPKKQPTIIDLLKGGKIQIIEVSKISANKATTESCFCDYHDDVVFAKIEKSLQNFDESNMEMKFLYAYKAFIFEFYKQERLVDIFRQCFKENSPAFQSKDMVKTYRTFKCKMEEFEMVKLYFDTHIMNKTFDGIVTCAIQIPEQIKFADYAYIAPNYDMDGSKIKNTINEVTHRIMITVFPEESQSWLLVSCLESEIFVYQKLFKQIKEAPIDKIKFYFNLILPLYSENIVLSPRLWENWDEKGKGAYTSAANSIGSCAMLYEQIVKFGLKNAAKSRSYKNESGINLFS